MKIEIIVNGIEVSFLKSSTQLFAFKNTVCRINQIIAVEPRIYLVLKIGRFFFFFEKFGRKLMGIYT